MDSSINPQPRTCDIFCAVVDNYGDIGVSWRLARQLANEHGVSVRLWVDDLHSFGKLCPELDEKSEMQHCRGVQLRHGAAKLFGAGATALHPLPQSAGFASNVSGVQVMRWDSDFPAVGPADLVIEAFACKLPESYIRAMAAQEEKPVWVNLEYLSAEDWVEGCHKLPSPHPTLPLTKYFFFPGFTEKTGGLLLERDLLARRDAFQSGVVEQKNYWCSLGVPERVAGELRVSLFGYENEAMEALLSAWEQGGQPVTCLLPEGRSLPQVAAFFGQCIENEKKPDPVRAEPVEAADKSHSSFDRLRANGGGRGDVWQRGNLRVHVLPFVAQERYDELLWACDINFVRGEDSCVRAQWAARPFIWQIYPQHDGVQLRHGAAEPSGAGATALRPLDETTSHSTRLQEAAAKSLVIPQSAGFAITSDLASVVGSPSRMASSATSNVPAGGRPMGSPLLRSDPFALSGVHLEKLEALRVRYTAGLSAEAAQAVRDLWGAWNGGQSIAAAWQAFVAQRMALQCHGKDWAQRLSKNNLALNLLDFFRQTE